MKIGIYSGSFNPVHIGHISLVEYIVNQGIVDCVWMIRSPQNPLKQSNALLSDEHRLKMLELAIEDYDNLEVCSIEDNLPKPNYTINTLNALKRKYPEEEFSLIIGADNWQIFDKWKDWDIILKDFSLIVYPRPGYEIDFSKMAKYPTVTFVDAPLFDVSSTDIRNLIKEHRDFSEYVPIKVGNYIKEYNLYL